jgi:plasmid stabilization system protein ParE
VTYRLTRQAEYDITAILIFLNGRNPRAAERYRDRFYDAFAWLGEHPHHGQSQPHIAPDTRHWIVRPYRILYR